MNDSMKIKTALLAVPLIFLVSSCGEPKRSSGGSGGGLVVPTIPVSTVPQPRIISGQQTLTIHWETNDSASSYNVYSSTQDFTSLDSIQNYATLPDASLLTNQTSPVDLNNLTNDQEYYVLVTAVTSDNSEQFTFAESQAVGIPRADYAPVFDAGDFHNIAVTDNGRTLHLWGNNGNGQLTNPTTGNHFATLNFSVGTIVTDVAAGFFSTYYLLDGVVFGFGSNQFGELGNGDTAVNSLSAISPTGLNNVVTISAGDRFVLALRNDGTVYSWGRNVAGQLGDGTTTDRTTPVQVSGLANIVAIDAGREFSMALKDDGTVYTWGFNANGQLGIGTTETSLTPIQIETLSNIAQISAGYGHAGALTASGDAYIWGFNGNGQLKMAGVPENQVQQSTPVKVRPLLLDSDNKNTGFDKIGTSAGATYLRNSDGSGSWYCSGSPIQAANGANDSCLIPGASGVDGGRGHAIAVKGNFVGTLDDRGKIVGLSSVDISDPNFNDLSELGNIDPALIAAGTHITPFEVNDLLGVQYDLVP